MYEFEILCFDFVPFSEAQSEASMDTGVIIAAQPVLPAVPLSKLLELPMEIRAEIYWHLFRSSRLSIEAVHPVVSHCGTSICSCWFPWEIINACKQLRSEALEHLLAATTLRIMNVPSKAKLLPLIFRAGIPRAMIMNIESFSRSPLDLSTFDSLRMLELHNIAVWCQYHDEEYLCSEEGDEVMFNLAMFNLKRNSAHLHELCSSKARSFKILLHCRYVVSSVKHETLVGSLMQALYLLLIIAGCNC